MSETLTLTTLNPIVSPVDSLQQYLAQIARFAVLNRDAEHELALRYYETGDREAAQQLVLANLRFVVKIANEYKAYGLRMADLIQEGNVGLLMAVKKFDPHKGFRLISYAVWWIRAYIQNFILSSWSLVRIGTTKAQRKLFYKLKQAKQKLLGEKAEGDLNRSLNLAETHELAEQLALQESDIKDMEQRLVGHDLSLNSPISDDQELTHLDLLSQPAAQEDFVVEQQYHLQLQDQVAGALQGLLPREQYIAERRLMSEEPMTLEAIGQHFGISRERARQLEVRTKEKLRRALATAA